MSEITTAAPAAITESAPPSPTTQDIAASVDAQLNTPTTETSSARVDMTDVTAAQPAAAAAATTPIVPEAELSAAAKFLLEQGHKARKEDGRDTWLPVKTVEKMLDRYLTTHRSTWDGERTTLNTRTTELQGHLEQLRAGLAGDPKAFLAELADMDARYKVFLEPPAARAALPAASDDPMPQPDYDLGNGQATYSREGVEKRMAWERRQAVRELEGKLDERLKPITEREKAAQERETRDRVLTEVRGRATSQLQEAQTWPLFGKLADDGSMTEFQQSVLDELKRDSAAAEAAGKRPTLSLEGAYIRIASKRFTEDDATKRGRLLTEINKAPRSTATTPTATDSARQRPRTTEDIARETITRLGG